MPNYINIIGDNYPTVEAYVAPGTDPTVYSNIIWVSAPISQATLDGLTEKPRYGKILVNITLGDESGNPLSIKTTSYKKMRSFVFPGKNTIGGRDPSGIVLYAYCNAISNTYIRIYDTTNNIEIGNATVLPSVTTETGIVISCSNWPYNNARFEIQGKVSSVIDNLYLSSLIILE